MRILGICLMVMVFVATKSHKLPESYLARPVCTLKA